MNKLYLLFLSILLFVEISSQTFCEQYRGDNASTDLCRRLQVESDATHCCFVPDDNERARCWQLTDDEYENIKRFKSFAKQYYNMPKLRIKCSSNILSSSLFILFSLFGLLF